MPTLKIYFLKPFTPALGRRPHFWEYQLLHTCQRQRVLLRACQGGPPKSKSSSVRALSTAHPQIQTFTIQSKTSAPSHVAPMNLLRTRPVSFLLVPEAPPTVPGPPQARKGYQTGPNQCALPHSETHSFPSRFSMQMAGAWLLTGSGPCRRSFVHSLPLPHPPPHCQTKLGVQVLLQAVGTIPPTLARVTRVQDPPNPFHEKSILHFGHVKTKETIRLVKGTGSCAAFRAGSTAWVKSPYSSANDPGLLSAACVSKLKKAGKRPRQDLHKHGQPWTSPSAWCPHLLGCLFFYDTSPLRRGIKKKKWDTWKLKDNRRNSVSRGENSQIPEPTLPPSTALSSSALIVNLYSLFPNTG